MLMMLMALSFVVSEPSMKKVASHPVASPEQLGIYKHKELPYTLNPRWQVLVITSQNGITPIQSAESNLDHWRNLVHTETIEEIAPLIAMQRVNHDNDPSVFSSIGFQEFVTNVHCPWHLAIQRHWPDYSYIEKVLQYDLIKTPTSQKPYYEAIVCSMPNIRCRAKTIDLLQDQLLQQYSQYLAKIVQDVEDYPNRQPGIQPKYNWCNGTFIAWLVGATSEEKHPEITQVFSFTTKVDHP